MKGIVSLILVVVVVGGGLYLLNPTMEDFTVFYQNRQAAETSKNVSGGLGNAISNLARGAAALAANIAFSRDDKLLFSVFRLGPADNPSEQYIGIARMFIKTR